MEKKVFKRSPGISWLRSDEYFKLVKANFLDTCRFTYFGGKCPYSNLTCNSCPNSYAYEKLFLSFQNSAKKDNIIVDVCPFRIYYKYKIKLDYSHYDVFLNSKL